MSSSKLVSVAIDFGTTYSGYAFSFHHAKNDIKTFLWKSSSFESEKTPTCILFDSERRFHSFGFKAEDVYAELSRRGVASSWFFFKQFKLALHDAKDLGRSTTIKDANKKEMLALEVFGESIRYLKDHALCQLGGTFDDDDIRWVLTVPAIWDDSAKQFMRLAAEMAGIVSKDLTLALEPEAASVYCRTLETVKDIFERNGTKYMVLDCGGGTMDIAIHEVQAYGKLKAIYRPSGGVWGGTKVDDEFQAFLLKLCGMSAIRTLSKHDMIEIQRSFENAKKKINPTTLGFVHVKLPIQLLQSMSPGVENCRVTGDKLSISANLMRGFFDKTIKKITQHIKHLLETPDLSDVGHLILVGGFSESQVFQAAIKETFPRMSVHTVVHSQSAVVRGAVICGHEPRVIRWRKSSYTYGVESCTKFVHMLHDESKSKYFEGTLYCCDIFSSFVDINQSLEVGKHKITKHYQPVCSNQKGMSLEFYRSTEQNPRYVTDPGCVKIGTLEVKMPDCTGGKNRSVDLTVEFGDTELKAVAVDRNSGVKFTSSFDFLST